MSYRNKLLIGLVGLTVAGSAFAHRHGDTYYDYAQVVNVDPITRSYDRPVSSEVCRDVPVEVYQPTYTYHHRDRTGATVAGAIVGGALGSLVGHGDGRRAATVAGALIGGSVAHDHARGGYYRSGGYYERGYEERCRTETDYRTSEEVTGYEVTFRYHGVTYEERMGYDPGNRVRVRVSNDGDDVEVAE